MPAIDDLKKAVTDLDTRVSAAVDSLTTLAQKVTDLTNSLAQVPNLDPDIEAAANSIQTLIGKLNGAIPTTSTPPPTS